jgi:hypothetical protein
VSEAKHAPLIASHSFNVLSFEPESSCLPSGENAHALTSRLWPVSEAKHAPLVASHSFNVLSFEPERNRFPSAENAHAMTAPTCP